MKKVIIILILAIAGIAAYFLFFSKEGVSFSKETSIYKAVPMDAPMFLELKSIKGLPLGKTIAQEIKKAGLFTYVFQKAEFLDTLVSGNKDIGNSVLNSPLVIAFTLEGKKNLVPLLVLKAETNSKKNNAINLIEKIFGTNYTSTKRSYNGRKITSYKSSNHNTEFHYAHTNGMLLASPKAILVEQAIRQLESQSILSENEFNQVNKTASLQSKIAIYINHKYFPLSFQNWLNPDVNKFTNEAGKQVRRSISSEAKKISNYASWSELDLQISDEEIILNGVTYPNDSLKNYLSVFNGQEPVRFQSDKYLPKKTAMFLSFCISDKDDFFNKLNDYLRHNELFYSREEALKAIERKSGTNIESMFQFILENEITVSFPELTSNPDKKTSYFILSTKGKSVAKEQMLAFLRKYASNNKLNFNDLQSQFVIDKETKHSIYEFPFPRIPGILLNGPFQLVDANYFAFWDNNLIFCNTKKGLEALIRDIILDATLGKDIDYLKYKQNIENKTNINFYFHPNQGYSIHKELFSNEVSRKLEEKEEFLRKFGPINWQVIHAKDLFFNNIYLKYTSEIKEDAKTTWQSNIGSIAIAKPQLVLNHNDLKNKEIIIQDEDNVLHQITKDGRSRWSVKIEGKIMGEIHQIDYLRNNKYQYLFNTKDKLYLLDRNGNNVAPFPVTLRSEASNGVSVFDYDNNRKYRYFVAGIDKKVYAYDSKGAIVSGWKFGTTDHLVTDPIEHFRIGGKDYIVFKDKSKIYIQNRRGETRVNVNISFENSNNELVLNTQGTAKLIATSNKGEVYYIYFNGNTVKKKSGKFSDKHFFTADDINGDGIAEFIFADGKELTVLNETGKKLFSEEFNSNISFNPNIYTFSSKLKKLGIVTSDDNKIYLVNPDGSLHNGFPLVGNSPFTIGKISSGSSYLNLIVASKDENIYNYRLN